MQQLDFSTSVSLECFSVLLSLNFFQERENLGRVSTYPIIKVEYLSTIGCQPRGSSGCSSYLQIADLFLSTSEESHAIFRFCKGAPQDVPQTLKA